MRETCFPVTSFGTSASGGPNGTTTEQRAVLAAFWADTVLLLSLTSHIQVFSLTDFDSHPGLQACSLRWSYTTGLLKPPTFRRHMVVSSAFQSQEPILPTNLFSPTYQSIHDPTHLSIPPFPYPSIHMSAHLSTHTPIPSSSIYTCIQHAICLPIHTLIHHLPMHPPIYPTICSSSWLFCQRKGTKA